MSWFDSTGFATLAKSALSTAQKTIDRALDIKEDGRIADKSSGLNTIKNDESFFSSFGLGTGSSSSESPEKTVTQHPPKSVEESSQMSQSGMWGDWGASFYGLAQLPHTSPPPVTQESPAETTQPCSSSVLPSSPVKDEEQVAVFQQPLREQLFPEEEKHQTTESSSPPPADEEDINETGHSVCGKTSAPLKLSKKITKSEDSSCTKKQETCQTELAPVMSVSTLLAELSPQVLKDGNSLPQSTESLVSDKSINSCSASAAVLEAGNETSTSSNESADTLCEDDDEDETEEELTVMEKKPPSTKELFLDLPTSFAPDIEPSSADYCVIEQGLTHDQSNNQESYSEQSISCSTSMEVILQAEVMSESTEQFRSCEDKRGEFNRDVEINSQVSSPDSVIPIYEEPPSNLPSPHFPDIHIIPTTSSYIAVSLDLIADQNMCDSDITVLSPSVGESTDSESCDNKHDTEQIEPREVRDCETSSSGSKVSHTSSSGSFVNCSLDDADQCEIQRDHSNSSNNNSERSSDLMGKETETSGHTSGDDIETTTSSDIEIISPPSGENGDRSSTSPLKHMLVPRLHKIRPQVESLSFSDYNKENLSMPIVLESDEPKVSHYETPIDSFHCGFERDYSESDVLMKRIATLQEVLMAREKRVLELSKENADMLEANNRMKSRVERLEETQSKGSEDVSKLTREFSQRLSQLESKLHETEKERDVCAEELSLIKEEFSKSVSGEEMAALLNEKNTQISELMLEGEKLSKQQLQLSTIIKKLRVKEKESESTCKSQKEKIEEQSKELERLRKSLGAKDEQEKKHIDAIRQLTTSVHRLEDEKALLKNELEDANTKLNSMKNNMDKAYKEMTDVQKKLAEKEREIEEASTSAEVSAKENFQHQFRQSQEQWNQERDTLLAQASQLRITLSRVEEQANIREESLREDIAALQQRLREADMKNDDLTQNISSATRPLLRQIENLQCMHNSQAVSWEKTEKTLSSSLQESQRQTEAAKEEAIKAEELLRSTRVQLTTSESHCKSLDQEKVELSSQLEVLKGKLALMEDIKLRESISLEAVKQNFAEEITQLKNEKETAIREILVLKEELEKRKIEQPYENVEQGSGVSCPSGRSSPTLSVTLSHHSSVSESTRGWAQEQGSESSFDVGGRSNLYEAWWGGSASTMIEHLQSQVKLRQGEVYQLQSEINRLDKVRENVTDDLSSIARKNEDLELQVEELQNIQQSFQELEQKYNTLLQMYGEKVEESEELKLDLSDVKAMYRAQIDELLRKS